MPEIEIDKPTVFSKPGCGQCSAVKRKLTAAGIEYQEIDSSQNEEAKSLLTEDWGYAGVPVTYYKGEHFYGYNPDRVDDLIQKVTA